MPTIKDLGKRLKAVTSTSKITKAMKMVAASKLRQAESAMKIARPFAGSMQSLMEPQIVPKEDEEPKGTASVLAISSDKGLCGGINSRVVKEIKIMCDAAEKTQQKMELNIVGGKALSGLVRTHSSYINMSFDETYKGPVTFSLASFLAEQMLSSPSETYTILYNNFKSVIAFEVKAKTYKGPEVLGDSGVFSEYEFEGDREVVLADIYQFNLACTVYGCLLENVTSEQASRMTAMDSASNNAKDMITRIALQYNRLRQAKITTELTEIVAGAESVS
eukprot:CAMPEP_0119303474 /NCGR_PEP_ID=MMETSP1333-20130426/4897_1 /TAXON_ID=418940 /ORGANISM="Scyphosphaera apsteinii, Strain RCC1455" /LENGTH=276 /DNA_ID=CAMNT_0007306157 /DNA_START=80 /DNA_END=910 /DNA_ORIENTATION=-